MKLSAHPIHRTGTTIRSGSVFQARADESFFYPYPFLELLSFPSYHGESGTACPGETCEFRFDFWRIAGCFLPGYRIHREFAGSDFPEFRRNKQTGDSVAEEPDLRIVRQTVFTIPHIFRVLFFPYLQDCSGCCPEFFFREGGNLEKKENHLQFCRSCDIVKKQASSIQTGKE